MIDTVSQILVVDLFKAWRSGSRRVRLFIKAALILTASAILILLLGYIGLVPLYAAEPIAGAFGIAAALIGIGISSFQSSLEQAERERKIEQVERRVQENPGEAGAAWELARVKLEKYVDRNLNQVRSIFWLTTLVMVGGFSLIIYGVVKAYAVPENFDASILSTAAGTLINFIGASFLVIYRSTMSQAKDYVTVLERINAVGMAVQILEKIDESEVMIRTQTTSDLAKQLLQLYGNVDGRRSQA